MSRFDRRPGFGCDDTTLFLRPAAALVALAVNPMKTAQLGLLVLIAGIAGCVARTDDRRPAATASFRAQSVDLQKLEDELVRHGLAGFRRIREAHSQEKFYSFAFFSNGRFSYVALTASNEEGLAQVANEYKQMPRYSAMSLENLKADLKWSPEDSPLHGAPEDVLTSLEPLLQGVTAELQRRSELGDAGKSFDEYTAELRTCIANALQRIDADGIFGTGEKRKQVVVNLLLGDQSDQDRLEFAERVNPAEAVEMLKRDFEVATRLGR